MKLNNFTHYLLLRISILLSVVLFGCDNNPTLFRAPEKSVEAIKTPIPSQSSLTLVTRISYDTLKTAINSKMPNSVSLGENIIDDCICANYPAAGTTCAQIPYLDFRGIGTQENCNIPAIVERRACAGCRWSATIGKNGDLALNRANNFIQISQPLLLKGQVGIKGDLANIFSLSGKNIEASLGPSFDLSFDINEQWCPVIGVNLHQNWVTSAIVEGIGRNCVGIDLGPLGHPQACAGPVNIDLTSKANEALSNNQAMIADTIRGAISCDSIKSTMSAHWRTFSIPINLPNGDTMHLNISPTGAGFSGLIPENDGLKFALLVNATTNLESKAIDEGLIPLPPLRHIDAQASQFAVNLHSHIPYTLLEKALGTDIKGKDFTKQTGTGDIFVHIDDLTIYPSKSRLAIGVKINAKLPGRLLNTAGWVYVLGKPIVVNNGSAIRLGDISYATVLDNKFWEVASSIFNEQILSKLKENSVINMASKLQEYEKTVSQQVNSSNVNGLSIKSKSTKIEINNVDLAEEHMIVSILLDLNFEATMSSLP